MINRYAYIPKHHLALANVNEQFKDGLRGAPVNKIDEYSPLSEDRSLKKVQIKVKEATPIPTPPVKEDLNELNPESGLTKLEEETIRKAAGHVAGAYFLVEAKREKVLTPKKK